MASKLAEGSQSHSLNISDVGCSTRQRASPDLVHRFQVELFKLLYFLGVSFQ